MKKLKYLFYLLSGLILLIFQGACSYLPEEAISGNIVHLQEETADYILLSSSDQLPKKAFLFVPGGLVDPHVYMCWMDKLVEMKSDVAVISLKIPSNLAIINPGKIRSVISEFPEIEQWCIGGHSLGGVVSAKAIELDPTQFDGLIFLAAWTTSYADLSKWGGKVLSISASNDGLASREEIEANESFLPPELPANILCEEDSTCSYTRYFEIPGGNHSGFGCYGFQEGDNESYISVEAQQDLMLAEIVKFIEEIWQ